LIITAIDPTFEDHIYNLTSNVKFIYAKLKHKYWIHAKCKYQNQIYI